jgi:hypothetical protein
VQDGRGGCTLHTHGTARALDPAESAALARLASDGLVSRGTDGHYALTEEGRRHLLRRLAGADGFAAQHQEREQTVLRDPDSGVFDVTVNHAESPLAWLRRRKGRDGEPMVSAHEYAAGERLRADYERGHLRPRVTANWTAAVAGKRRDGVGGVAELTETALAARRRVDAALRAVDREFAGLLVDLCCYLKGLEEIERERRLPARSAKVLVKLGLGRLARHYGLSPKAEGPDWSRKLLHWGTEDYRPRIDG